jgi:FtsH-binding integral membrane protein
LTLYMDFINLFLNLLQLFGGKKDWCGECVII